MSEFEKAVREQSQQDKDSSFYNEEYEQYRRDIGLSKKEDSDLTANEEGDGEIREIVVANPADVLPEDDPRKKEVDQKYKEAQAQISESGWTSFADNVVTPFRKKLYENTDKLGSKAPYVASADMLIGSTLDTVEELGNSLMPIANDIEDWMQENGFTQQDFIKDDTRLDFAERVWPEITGTTAGSVTRAIVGHVAPMAGIYKGTSLVIKGTSAAAKIGRGTATTALNAGLSYVKQDPEGENLSNMIANNYDFMQPIVGFLAIDPEDTEVEAKQKAALESVIFDIITLGGASAAKPVAKVTGKAVTKGAKGIAIGGEFIAEKAAPIIDKASDAIQKTSQAIKDTESAGKITRAFVNSVHATKKAMQVSNARKKILDLRDEITQELKDIKKLPMGDQVRLNEYLPKSLANKELSKQSTVLADRTIELIKKDEEILQRVAQGKQSLIAEAQEIIKKGNADELFEKVVQGQASEADIVAVKILRENEILKFAENLRAAKISRSAVDQHAVMVSLNRIDALDQLSGRIASDSGAKLKLEQYANLLMDSNDFANHLAISKMMAKKSQIEEAIELGYDLITQDPDNLLRTLGGVAKRTRGQKLYDVLLERRTNNLLSSLKTQATSIGSALTRAPIDITNRYIAAKLSKRNLIKDIKKDIEMSRKWHAEHGVDFDEVAVTKDIEDYYKGAIAKGEYNLVFEEEALIMAREFMKAGGDEMLAAYASIIDFIKLGNTSLKTARMSAAQATKRGLKPDLQTFKGASGIKNKAITAKNFGLNEDKWYGKLFNAYGMYQRSPSWLLSKGDDATGMMHYRMQINSLAYRQARQMLGELPEGASKADVLQYKKNMKEITDNIITGNLDNMAVGHADLITKIRKQAVDASNQARFLNEVPDYLGTVNKAVHNNPVLRLLMPFSRVELNILSQTIDRTPMAVWTKRYQDAIAKGGADAAEAQAKVVLGTSIMGVSTLLAANGIITGPEPKNKSQRDMMRAAGYQFNSIKIGDNQLNYEKFGEPMNSLLRYGSLLSQIVGYANSEWSNPKLKQDTGDLILATAMGLVEVATPEFLTEGFGEIIRAVEGEYEGVASKITADFMASILVDMSSFQRDVRKTGIPLLIDADPYMRDKRPDPEAVFPVLDRMFNNVMDNIPGLSKNLPIMRNIFGEPVKYPAGFGPDIISPVIQMKRTNDPVVEELIRLGVTGPLLNPEPKPGEDHLVLSMPSNVISVNVRGTDNSFQMTPHQYDRFMQLVGNNNGELGFKYSLKDAMGDRLKAMRGMPDQLIRVRIKELYEERVALARKRLQVEDMSIIDKIRMKKLEVINAYSGRNTQ